MLSVTAWCLIGVPVQQWARYLKMIHNSGYEGIELHVDLQPWPISIKTKKDEDEKLKAGKTIKREKIA